MKTIEVGKIVNTHGLKGEVKVVSWCDYPEMFEDFAHIYSGKDKFEIENIKYHKESVILKLSGVDSINDAERMKNRILEADRDEFMLPEGSYFIVDIIGLKVRSNGAEIGVIVDVIQTGANDVYVIKRPDKKDLLLPVLEQTVIETNLESGYIDVRIMEGLDEL